MSAPTISEIIKYSKPSMKRIENILCREYPMALRTPSDDFLSSEIIPKNEEMKRKLESTENQKSR